MGLLRSEGPGATFLVLRLQDFTENPLVLSHRRNASIAHLVGGFGFVLFFPEKFIETIDCFLMDLLMNSVQFIHEPNTLIGVNDVEVALPVQVVRGCRYRRGFFLEGHRQPQIESLRLLTCTIKYLRFRLQDLNG